jgi:hypothetical protein
MTDSAVTLKGLVSVGRLQVRRSLGEG